MTTTEEKVFDRIRKLLSLSRSSNEHEAASAAARAQALMAEHQIEDAQLRLDEGDRPAEPITKVDLDASSRKIVHWKSNIANGLARSLGARMWWSGATVRLIGRPSAIRAITYMYQYLVREVDRLADDGWNTRGAWDGQTVRSWKHGFRIGASNVIEARLIQQSKVQREEREVAMERATEVNATTGALVLVEREEREVATAYDEMAKKFKRTISGPSVSSGDGYRRGAAAGQNVSLGGGARLGATPGKLRAV